MPRSYIEVRGPKAVFEIYRRYYVMKPRLELPPDIEYREFAFQPWGSSSYVRHISFRSEDEVYEYFVEKIPLHAYYSLARYELPGAPSMEEKGFIGADLMFDIDADHLEGCRQDIIDDECLRAAAEAAHRLVRILKRDFGIKRFTIYFTGHRGFHTIASCEFCDSLTREERQEIAHYIAGVELNVELLFPEPRGEEPLIPDENEPGWRGWIGEALSSLAPERRGGGVPTLKKILGPNWVVSIREIVEKITVPIDLQVTQDLSRLVRIPGSLNGKTGLRVSIIEDPLKFKPNKELAPIEGEAVVKALRDLNIESLLGESLELKAGRRLRLDAGVALVLASKGFVEIEEVAGYVKAPSRGRPV